MNEQSEEQQCMKYPAVIRELEPNEGGGFLAEIPDLPGCIADGETVAEAMDNLKDALAAWTATARELDRQIPDPSTARERYSGKWVQRVPKSLHAKLVTEAKREGVSLNTLATAFLAEGMGKRRVA
jgi:antitoxin HicB